jgi:hypothetical protein
MRALYYIALVFTAVSVGVAVASNKQASAEFEPHDAVIYLHIALPEGVETFPTELVPLP